MAVHENCRWYRETTLYERIPETNQRRPFLYRECAILRRAFCVFEECTFFKTEKMYQEEVMKCRKRLEKLKKENEDGEDQQQTEGSSLRTEIGEDTP